jgi:hemoglobin-like flavoprotein
MEAIAYTHAHDHMDIKPEFYPLWLESMLRTIKAHDPNFSEVLEEAWREVLTFTINFMIFKI